MGCHESSNGPDAHDCADWESWVEFLQGPKPTSPLLDVPRESSGFSGIDEGLRQDFWASLLRFSKILNEEKPESS